MAIELKVKTREIPTKEINLEREKGNVPAELYGDKQKNQHLNVDLKAFTKVFKEAGKSALIDLLFDDNKAVKVIISNVQFHPLTDKAIHADFYIVDMNKEIHTKIPLIFFGESRAVKELAGTMIQPLDSLEISCMPADLIHEIKVDISSVNSFGDVIQVKDLDIPESITVKADLESVVATAKAKIIIEEPTVEEETDGEEGEEKKEGKEGEAKEGEEKKEGKEGEAKEGEAKKEEGKPEEKK